MSALLAWRRERMPGRLFGSLAVLLALCAQPPLPAFPASIAAAWLMLAAFRLRDDLADRATDPSDRVLVRTSDVRLFWVATVVALGLATALIGLVSGPGGALVLLATALALELAYRLHLPGKRHWVGIKYPAFAAVLGLANPYLLAAIYLIFAAYEYAHDPPSTSTTAATDTHPERPIGST